MTQRKPSGKIPGYKNLGKMANPKTKSFDRIKAKVC
jgi:hypothetical protein